MPVGDAITLPPTAQSADYRMAVGVWERMFNRTLANQEHAPNYSRWIGNIVAGLMQARPPVAAGLTNDDDLDLSEFLEDTARVMSGMGVAFIRPVHNGEEWTDQVLGPERVTAIWNHRRLQEAIVWSLMKDPIRTDKPDAYIAVVERWMPDGRVEAEVWQGDKGPLATDAFTSKKKLPLGSLPEAIKELPAVAGVLADLQANDTQPLERYIIPVVWQWQNAYPAPIIAGNEHVVQGLERLWDQEQVDAEMARNRIAIDTKMLATNITYSTGGDIIANPGFGLRDNVLALTSPAGGAQGIDKALPFHVISFPDSLTQRERIERRENSLLESCGINPQSVGRSVGGRSDSASAKRADQQMTLQTVATPARKMSRALSDALTQRQRLNGTATGVTVTVYEGVRPVASECAEDAQTLAAAQAASTVTLIRTAHPTWDDVMVNEEYARMAAEGLVTMPAEGADPVDSGVKDDADAMGVLIRAGVDPDDAATRVGLPGLKFTGAVPTSLRLPESDAASLETA